MNLVFYTAFLTVFSVLGLSACGDVKSRLADPRVVQGSPLAADQLKNLRIGMTQAEVQAFLGAPVLNTAVSPDRWHYVFVEQRGQHNLKHQRVTLVFSSQKLKKVEIIE